jgi:vacuolar-type H+-ATPase subunit I/STV1
MKINRSLSSLLAAAALLCAGNLGSSLNLQAGEPGSPEGLHRQAAELQEQVDDLKAAGRHEEAMRLQREIEELWHAAELRADRNRERRVERPGQVQPERRPVQERERMEREEHFRAMHHAEVAELKHEILRLHEELAARSPRPPERRFNAPRRHPGEPDFAPPPFAADREERERRIHHVEVAIENLHAAGLHDMAERLADELNRRRERLPEPMPHAEALERVTHELHELRNQMKELRGNLRELQEKIGH